jgi:DNA-binding CsgD family transcriptional regulator
MPASAPSVDTPETKLLELVGDVCGLLDIGELRRGMLDAIQRALPSLFVSLNDIGPRPGEIVALMLPEVSDPAAFQRWAEHAHENPLLQYYLRTQDGRAMRFSDVISQQRLRATALYRELYAPLGVEHQLAFTLPAGTDRVLAIALSRGEHDYSDAERDLADRARPFLIQAYLNAIAFESSRQAPLEPGSSTPLLESLQGAGLTPREAESLRLVALGRSNHHIAGTLGISHRTVGKHLERSFRKLGVGDRSSAAARVWELADVSGDASGP